MNLPYKSIIAADVWGIISVHYGVLHTLLIYQGAFKAVLKTFQNKLH